MMEGQYAGWLAFYVLSMALWCHYSRYLPEGIQMLQDSH
jgi:hypothetical protein